MNTLIILSLLILAIAAVIFLISLKDAFSIANQDKRAGSSSDSLFEIDNNELAKLQKLQQTGRQKDAINFAKTIAQKNPTNLYGRYILGMSYFNNFQYREAAGQFETILKHQPKHIDTREVLADCYAKMKYWQRAITEYEIILKVNPDDIDVQKKAVNAYANTRSTKRAIDLLTKITMAEPDDFDSLKKLADLYIQGKEFNKSIEVLNFALKEKPQDIDVLEKLATAYKNTNRADDAINTNLKLTENLNLSDIKEQQIYIAANKELAELYTSKKSYSEALVYYQNIIEHNEKNWEEYGCKVAYINFKEGHKEKALEILEKLIENNQNPKDAITIMSRIYTEDNEYSKAIKACQTLLAKTPDSNSANYYKRLIGSLYKDWGIINLEKDDLEQALSKLAESLKYNAKDPEVYYNIAIINHQHQDYTAAVTYIQKASNLNPSEPKYHIDMANIYDDLNNFDAAIECFNQAIILNPGNIECRISKGVMLAKNQRYTEAIELFRKILVFEQNNADIYYNLALCYEHAQNIKSAYQNYEKALEIDPQHTEAQNNIDILRKSHNFY